MVDFIRTPYRIQARPFADSEETAEMVWYPALPDAPTLPYPTVFNSLHWQPFPLNKTSPGEVPGAEPVIAPDGTKAGATGLHQCGTPDEFLEGVLYDPDAHVEYNDDGLPVCCEGFVRGACGCGVGGAVLVTAGECGICAFARPAELGTTLFGTFPVTCTHWYVLDGLANGNYTITSTFSAGGLEIRGVAYAGPACSNLLPQTPFDQGGPVQIIAVTNGVLRIEILGASGTGQSYTVRVDPT